MEPRFDLNANELGAKIGKRFANTSMAIMGSTLPKSLIELVELRASQINGCGYCVDAHAKELAAAGISVLHAHGPKNTLELPPGTPSAPYVAVPYLSRMDLAYAAADAVVCRSGAMTVAEVSAVGLPAVYVPLPHGNGEQELNARPVVAAGGGTIVADSQLTPSYVIDEVIALLTDPARLTEMGRAAAGAGHRDAADEVARIAVRVAGR
ncbi:carboxymuconolactone decarboxylase family protein [Nocardia cyriacigeorgica]|nr:glycosyltransferase [Nocardia cyriacigeorgica]MBF6481413.1 carboxymuconolactone decarboxylase family protein [Nocardia cyriacigeorgica]